MATRQTRLEVMRTSKFSDNQIFSILKAAEGGVPVTELCREHNISSACFHKWPSKFGGMDASLIKRMRELEAGNARRKKPKHRWAATY